MRLTFSLLLFNLAFAGFVLGIEYYSSAYDNVDVDSILSSDRLFNQYIACIFDNGTCTADGRNFKRIIPDAIVTNCEKCNPVQRQMAKKMITHVKERKPDVWSRILKEYNVRASEVEKFLAQSEQ